MFEPAFRFSLEGSWDTVGESSSSLGLTTQTATEAGCRVRFFCRDTLAFFGEEVVGDLDVIAQLREHPAVVKPPHEVGVGGRAAVAVELLIPYEVGDDGSCCRVTGDPLPSEVVDELPDLSFRFTHDGGGAIRFIHLEDPPLLIQITSPTAEGLGLFGPRAQQVLDSIEFVED